mmetsp:Transcript_79466/g.221138  ORF Transcript_79466/g.221138 Transcript_79466/m.221138 type:complete len:169 (-) Transcript_79466:162-668(-)
MERFGIRSRRGPAATAAPPVQFPSSDVAKCKLDPSPPALLREVVGPWPSEEALASAWLRSKGDVAAAANIVLDNISGGCMLGVDAGRLCCMREAARVATISLDSSDEECDSHLTEIGNKATRGNAAAPCRQAVTVGLPPPSAHKSECAARRGSLDDFIDELLGPDEVV